MPQQRLRNKGCPQKGRPKKNCQTKAVAKKGCPKRLPSSSGQLRLAQAHAPGTLRDQFPPMCHRNAVWSYSFQYGSSPRLPPGGGPTAARQFHFAAGCCPVRSPNISPGGGTSGRPSQRTRRHHTMQAQTKLTRGIAANPAHVAWHMATAH